MDVLKKKQGARKSKITWRFQFGKRSMAFPAFINADAKTPKGKKREINLSLHEDLKRPSNYE